MNEESILFPKQHPSEWVVRKLSTVATVNMGQSPPSEECNVDEKGIPFYQGNSEFGSKYPNPIWHTTNPTKISDPEDILISVRAPVGDININQLRACIGRGVAAITPKKIDRDYLFYYLKFSSHYFSRIQQGSTFQAINSSDLRNTPIAIPPNNEPTKIADILSTVDQAIEETEEIIIGHDRIRQGLLQNIFTRGLGHTDYQDTEFGKLPRSWGVKELRDIGTFKKGKNIAIKDVKEQGIPCVRYGEIYTDHDYVIKDFTSFIDSNTAKSSTKIQAGDILFTGSGETLGEIGKCVAYMGEEEAYTGGDVIILRVKEQNSVYLSYLLSSRIIRKQINRLGQGHSVVHVYPKQLAGVKVWSEPLVVSQ